MTHRYFERERMVNLQLRKRGIIDERVLNAMLTVERHHFVPPEFQALAYADRPLPLGKEQTISQPYIVAFMCQTLNLSGNEKALEIGTGSGYQTAILTLLAKEVFTIEIRKELDLLAQENLAPFQSEHLHFKIGNGLLGWQEEAPFDAVILSASPEEIPETLLKQLALGGKLIAPIGGKDDQTLILVEATPAGFKKTNLMQVTFVPTKSDESRE